MKRDIETRVFAEADYIIKNKCTVRAMTKYFNISKSTIHYDLTCRLKKLNRALFDNVDKVLKYNFSQRHIRGGVATKSKYENLKKQDKNK